MSNKRRKRVVGIRYEQDKGAPRVIVKGSGQFADKIIKERDRLDGAPVIRDEKLLDELYRLPMDSEIGSDLFELVAILLIHVFSIEGKSKEKFDD